jgi:RimJ/RimL family protein N-acetyltransferase
MPTLHTNRLLLRKIESDDLHAVHELLSLQETDRFNAFGIPENLGITESIVSKWILDQNSEKIEAYTFAIESQSDGKFIGLISFRLGKPNYRNAEMWFKLHIDFWGLGYATEAVRAILKFGFNELKLHRIEAGCAVENLASFKVLEKTGMLLEGRKRQVLPLKTGWSDTFEFAILEKDKIFE